MMSCLNVGVGGAQTGLGCNYSFYVGLRHIYCGQSTDIHTLGSNQAALHVIHATLQRLEVLEQMGNNKSPDMS
jgi:hypothetical protein